MLSDLQRQFLEDNYNTWEWFSKTGSIKSMDMITKNGLLDAARAFDQRYLADLNCGACVADLIRYVFTQYDKVRNAAH
jgi:hypothetical protein